MKRKWIALILAVALLVTMVPLFKGLAVAVTSCRPPASTYMLHVTGTKVWDDNNDAAGKRPDSIKIGLYKRTGNSTPIAIGVAEISPDDDEKDSNEWNIDIEIEVDHNYWGGGARYFLKEIEIPDEYDPTIEGFNISIGKGGKLTCKPGGTITNTSKTTKVRGEKTWEDDNDQDGLRPLSITVNLYKEGVNDYVKQQVVLANAEGKWIYEFDNLPRKENGKIINYYVREEETVEGYTATYDDNYNIKNSHTPEKIDISGVKTWDDGEDRDGLRPKSITINLMRAGQADAVKSLKVSADEYGVWSWSFKDLPKYDNGEEIEYSIAEDNVPNYETTIDGYNITNKHVPEKTSITVKKVWEGRVPGTSYPSVTVILYQQVVEEGTVEFKEVATLTLDSEHNWEGSFDNLYVYEDGIQIIYSVKEGTVPGYLEPVYTPIEGGFKITNTIIPPSTVPPNTQPAITTTEETTEEPTTSEIVAGDEDEKTTTTITQPTEVVAGDEDEVDVVPTGENYLYLVVAILFILGGVIVLVPAIKKVRVKK